MRNYKKLSTTFLSVLLIVLTVFTLPLQVAATSLATADEMSLPEVNEGISYDESEDVEAIIIGEDKTKRDEYTKHFLTDAGTTIIAQYAVPVHYKNSDGEYVDFDNSLITSEATVSYSTQDEATADETSTYNIRTTQETVQTEKIFINKKSDSKVSHFKKSGKTKLVEISREGHTISWGYSGSHIVDAENKTISNKKLTGNDAYLNLQNLSSTVLYENIYNNIDLEVINSTAGVKENIILKAPNTKNVFNIEYNIGDLSAESIDNQTIVLKDTEGKVVYTITAPYMMDTKGAQSEALELRILKNNKGKLSVKLTADKTWLKDKDRAYPVTIDPYFEYGQDWGQIQSTFVNSAAPNTEYTEGSFYVGRPDEDNGIRRSLVKVPNLPTLNIGDMVIKARVILWQVYNNPTITMYAGLYESLDDWTELDKVTWTSQPGFSSTLIDYEKCNEGEYGWRDWDITELVKKWYNGDENNGFYLAMMNESNTGQGLWFTSSSYPTDSGVRPSLEIAYRNNKGLESYWDYTAISAGTAGVAHINNYSGNLVFETAIADTHGLKFPANTSLIYNSYVADNSYRSVGTPFGFGWKMNLHQTIHNTLQFGLGNSDYLAVYTDEDGTDHYFRKEKSTDTTFVDEDGLGLTMEYTDSEYIITNKDKTKLYFSKGTSLLTKIKNSSNQEISLSYIGETNLIDKITDADGNVIALTGGSRVTSITDPAGRVTTFGYDSDGYYLTSITRPDGNTVQFSYNSDGLLTKVTDIDGSYIVFTYEDNETCGVKTVQEFDADDNPGQTLAFDRTKYNTTVMQSSGADCVFDTNDDILTTYQYDNLGRTTSVSAKTTDGEDLGAASATYTSGINSTASNIKSQNRVTQSYSMGANRENLVVNHNLESLSGWTVADFDGQGGLNTAALSTEQKLYGAKSLKFNVTSAIPDTRDALYQDISSAYLSAGATYTLSAYVNVTSVTPSANAADYGAVLFADLYTSGTSYTTSTPDYISSATESTVNSGFRRLSTTFTVPENISKIRVYLAFVSATGTAYFDGIQLEKSDAPSSYNMLENASFERMNTTTTSENYRNAKSWEKTNLTLDGSTDFLCTDAQDGTYSFAIKGDVGTAKHNRQDVAVSGNKADTYILSGWAKGDAVPNETNNSFFELRVEVFYSDGSSVEKRSALFNTSISDWQYSSFAFNLDDQKTNSLTPTKIRVYIISFRQGNYLYFDNLALTKEAVPSYTYNEDGDLVSVVANAEQDSSYEYADNRLTEYVDPKGNSYTYEYDEDTKLLTSATTQKGATYTYTYDDYGNAKEVVGSADGLDSLKAEITYTYPTEDSTTYSVTAKDQDKNTFTEVYDKSTGTLQSVTDTKGIITNYTYDSDTDRVLSIVKNNNQSVEYTYDDYGRYTGISHEGTNYYFTYDAFGNRINTKVGSRVLSTNTYAPYNGSLTQTTYGNGTTISYTYDAYGNAKTVSYNGTVVSRNFTDSAGNINRTQDLLTNLEHRVTYDFTGRLISKEVLNLSASGARWHRSLEYDYDLNNNVTRFAYADRNGSNITQFAYGLDNLLEKTTLQNGKEVTYNYDAFGRLTGKSLNTSTPLNYSYTYEVSDWGADYTTTKIECETIGDTTYKYTYDEYGNITEIFRVNADSTPTILYSYSYDQYNQLMYATDHENLQKSAYNYNQAGNITRRYKYQLDAGLNITSTLENIRYVYGDSEWKDLLTTYNGQTITYDAIGNPLNYRDDITLTWQNGRELATYSDDNYDITYTYDASGMRTGKSVTNSAGTTNAYTYVYENGQLLQMCMGSRIYDFSYDANGVPVSIAYRTRATATPTYYFYGVNSRGDVIALYNSGGTLVACYNYDAYGKLISVENATGVAITSATHIANMNPLRYRGYVYDTESGIYYLQSRYYDPTTCRFVNEDSYYDSGIDLTGYNMFAYCNNNPVMYSDPTGNCPTHTYYYMPSCPDCNPDLAAVHAERGKDWAMINVFPERYLSEETVSINGTITDSTPLVSVIINPNNIKDGELDPNIRIENSYRIKSPKAQEIILDLIIASPEFDSSIYKRSKESWISEWKGHNFLHRLFKGTEWKNNAKHVDLDENEWFFWGLIW